MGKIITQDRVVLWFQENGYGTQWIPYGVGDKAGGMSGKSIPAPGRSPVYGRNEFGKPVTISKRIEPPGDLPTATVQVYERGQIDLLRKALDRGCPINIQSRLVSCGRLNNPNVWDKISHWEGGQITGYTPGDAPSLEYNGEEISNEATVAFDFEIELVATALSALSSGSAQDLLDIAAIPDEDCNECGNGYAGADRLQWIGTSAGAGVTAELLFSNNGSSYAATSADPFAADEDISDVEARPVSKDQVRVIVGTNTTDAGAKAKFAYADVTYGDEGTTTWTTVNIAAGTNGDVIEAMSWASFDRLYIATAGDIYVSTDQGISDPGSATYTGSTVINGFTASPDGDQVWAWGASNLILRELDGNGIFETRVGPSGGGAFTAMAIAANGRMFAGNGTSIYRNKGQAENTGNWTELKDFGSNKVVTAIQCVGGFKTQGGSSEILRVIVDDTTPGAGEVWMSVDGGATFFQITELTNTGYNGAYFSQVDDNLATIIGDGGTIHYLSSIN